DHAGSNPYQITVTISHEGAPSVTAKSTATVSDPAVVATGGFVGTARAGRVSARPTGATFTDPAGAEGVGDYGASISWGGGSATSSGSFSLSDRVSPVPGRLPYTALFRSDHAGSNPYQITVTINHEGAATATATSSATVSDPAV